MTNIHHEYPEIADECDAKAQIERAKQLKHYQGMALDCVEPNLGNLTDRELVRHCLNHSSSHALVRSLAQRLETQLNEIDELRDTISHTLDTLKAWKEY